MSFSHADGLGACPANVCDMAEEYYFGRLTEDQRSRFERHFLLCPSCASLVQETFQFIEAFRLAAGEVEPRGA